jgi:prepilin-type N-terminal cleavage/methylation domain-containing protein
MHLTPCQPSRHAGFTLIELGIVLAVVALLAAGLLVAGRAMIRRGEVTDLIAKTRDLASASRSFKSRYSFFPGDLPNAANYLTADGGVSAGCNYAPGGKVGNGLVDTATESSCALEHLLRAGLLTKLSYQGGTYRIPGPDSANLSLWFNAASNENVVRIANLACDLALEIDAKLDTVSAAGTPLTDGQVQGRDGGGAALSTCVPGQANDPVAELLVRY